MDSQIDGRRRCIKRQESGVAGGGNSIACQESSLLFGHFGYQPSDNKFGQRTCFVKCGRPVFASLHQAHKELVTAKGDERAVLCSKAYAVLQRYMLKRGVQAFALQAEPTSPNGVTAPLLA